MDELELATALGEIRRREEEEARPLEERIKKTRLVTERYEKRLESVRAKYEQQYHQLVNEFRSRTVIVLPDPISGDKAERRDQRIGKRSLDEPLLSFLRARDWSKDPTFTVSLVADEWNRVNPDTPVGRATIRGVLDRLVEQKKEVILLKEGGRGRSEPRTYGFMPQ